MSLAYENQNERKQHNGITTPNQKNAKNSRARAIGKSLSTFYGYGPEAPQLWRAERARARARAKYPENFFLIMLPWTILNFEIKLRNQCQPFTPLFKNAHAGPMDDSFWTSKWNKQMTKKPNGKVVVQFKIERRPYGTPKTQDLNLIFHYFFIDFYGFTKIRRF